jgi:hypothetical protein
MTQKQLEDYLWGVYQPLIHWRKSRNEIRSLSLIRGLSFLRLLTTKMMGVGLGHYPVLQPDHLRWRG